MKITPIIAKEKLNSAISGISDTIWLFSKDPNADFTRERKLPVGSLLRLLLEFSGKSLQNELSAYYVPPGKTYQRIPSKSAFTQQRHKLLWQGSERDPMERQGLRGQFPLQGSFRHHGMGG